MAPGMLSSLHDMLVMQLTMLDNCVMMLGHLHGLVNQLVTACLCPSPSWIPSFLTCTHDSQPILAIFALLNAPQQKSIYSKPQLAPCPPAILLPPTNQPLSKSLATQNISQPNLPSLVVANWSQPGPRITCAP